MKIYERLDRESGVLHPTCQKSNDDLEQLIEWIERKEHAWEWVLESKSSAFIHHALKHSK